MIQTINIIRIIISKFTLEYPPTPHGFNITCLESNIWDLHEVFNSCTEALNNYNTFSEGMVTSAETEPEVFSDADVTQKREVFNESLEIFKSAIETADQIIDAGQDINSPFPDTDRNTLFDGMFEDQIKEVLDGTTADLIYKNYLCEESKNEVIDAIDKARENRDT